MRYKSILRISDVVVAVEDWKRDLITDEELAQKFLDAYKAIKSEAEPPAHQNKADNLEEK